MRWGAFLLVVCLAGCGHASSELSRFSEPGLNVATAALQGGSPEIALQVADRILAGNPNSEAALVVQGDALTGLGRPSEARVSYNKALAVQPSSVGARIGLGRLDLATAPARSELLFMQALHDEPRNTTALNDLGVARDLLGDHAGAQEAYGRALGIKPDLVSAEVNLALSLAMSGDGPHAVQLIRPLAEQPGASAQTRQDFAAVLAMSGDRTAAREILSAKMSQDDVDRALDAYASARAGGAPPAQGDVPSSTGQVRGASNTPQDMRPVPLVVQTAASPTATSGPAAPTGQPMFHAQFAALPSEAAARTDWQRLQNLMPGLLNGHAPEIIRVDLHGQTFWRLRVGGFGDSSSAEAFCLKVRQAGEACASGGGA